MEKDLYVIFDKISNEFGEVLSFNGVDDAKRSFAIACAQTGLHDDLELFYLGHISLESHGPVLVGDVPVVVCDYNAVKEEVEKYSVSMAMRDKINSVVSFEYSGKEFVENVQKLCRYFSKKDKRFGK